MSIFNIDNSAGAVRKGWGACGLRETTDGRVARLGRCQADTAETVRRLRGKLERYRKRRARQAGWTRRFIPTGLVALDDALPHGGLPCGAVTEILSDGSGVGAMTLAMRIATRIETGTDEGVPECCEAFDDHRYVVLIDTFQDFYPPAAAQRGVALDRLIVIRPSGHKEAFWALDQSLRCRAVAVVIAPLVQLDEVRSRRLQLAAESSGALGLVLGAAHWRTKSFAAVQMLVEGAGRRELVDSTSGMLPSTGRPAAPAPFGAVEPYLCRITLRTVREGMPAGPFMVDLHHEAGVGSVPSVPVDRPAAKTG